MFYGTLREGLSSNDTVPKYCKRRCKDKGSHSCLNACPGGCCAHCVFLMLSREPGADGPPTLHRRLNACVEEAHPPNVDIWWICGQVYVRM